MKDKMRRDVEKTATKEEKYDTIEKDSLQKAVRGQVTPWAHCQD
jgi:hypothetical protein